VSETKKHWLQTIDWSLFNSAKVNREHLALIQAAALVEANGPDYAAYLVPLFPEEALQSKIRHWAWEETVHGEALGRWARLADPAYDLESARQRFSATYRVPIGAASSVRGSPAREMLARCVVESGTSSFYRALADATEEPLLKLICTKIAADEIRHYRMFLDEFRRLDGTEKNPFLERAKVVYGRIAEVEDEEFAAAYYAAHGGQEAFDVKKHGRAYLAVAFGIYRPEHTRLAAELVTRALGLRLPKLVAKGVGYLSARSIARKAAQFRAAA